MALLSYQQGPASHGLSLGLSSLARPFCVLPPKCEGNITIDVFSPSILDTRVPLLVARGCATISF